VSKAPNGFGLKELFQILRNDRPRTRSELAELTGISRSTIGLRVDTLLASGLIVPLSDAVSTGGRPSARVAFNPSARIVAAADLGATHATVAITDLSGTVLGESHSNLLIASGPEKVLDYLTQTIGTLLDDLQRNDSDLVAIGIGLPGPVEHTNGIPSKPPLMPGWDGFDVPQFVRKTYDVPVLVDNDVNIMALGERAMHWPDATHLVFLKVATGIGSGIISGGVLQRGADGVAGDVGHISVSHAAGVACHCGNTGCLEAVAGGPAIATALRKRGLDVTTGGEVVALVRQGNLEAIQAIRQAGRDIGEMLNMCVSFINPQIIVIGGSTAHAGEHLLGGIREVVYARAMPLATRNLIITESQAGAKSAVLGASLMAIEYALLPENIDVLARRKNKAR
jgi:predicted NBD/HSP70 family sugar kinase